MRPELAVSWEKDLTVTDNRVMPVRKEFTKNGVKAIIEILSDNTLVADIYIPGDTVTHTEIIRKDTASRAAEGKVTRKDTKKKGGLGLRKYLLLGGIALSIVLAYFKFRRKKSK